jgi:hypothetical protein
MAKMAQNCKGVVRPYNFGGFLTKSSKDLKIVRVSATDTITIFEDFFKKRKNCKGARNQVWHNSSSKTLGCMAKKDGDGVLRNLEPKM